MELEFTDHYIVVAHWNRKENALDDITIWRVPVWFAWAKFFYVRWAGSKFGMSSLIEMKSASQFWYSELDTAVAEWWPSEVGTHHYIVEAIRNRECLPLLHVATEFLASLHEQGSL